MRDKKERGQTDKQRERERERERERVVYTYEFGDAGIRHHLRNACRLPLGHQFDIDFRQFILDCSCC